MIMQKLNMKGKSNKVPTSEIVKIGFKKHQSERKLSHAEAIEIMK